MFSAEPQGDSAAVRIDFPEYFFAQA